MKTLRLWTVITVTWFFVFYNVERLHAPLNIASFVYGYVTLLAIVPLVFRSLGRVAITYLAVGAGLLLLTVKVALGYPVLHSHLPITVTELCTCLIGLCLGKKLSEQIFVIERAVLDFVVPENNPSYDFTSGQEAIYREIQRARQFKRSLVMVGLAPDQVSAERCSSALLEELRQIVERNYFDARFRELVGGELRDCDFFCRRGDHFLMVLPESSTDDAQLTVQRIVQRARSELSVELKFGMSGFPDEEVTFAGLLDHVEFQIAGENCELTEAPVAGPSADLACSSMEA